MTYNMLLIDTQNSFCKEDGSLFVGGRSGNGAATDVKTLSNFININSTEINNVFATFDAHKSLHIFSPNFWVDTNNKNPEPFSMISKDDMVKQVFKPSNIAVEYVKTFKLKTDSYKEAENWLNKYVLFYADELEKSGGYILTIWPVHCVVGTEGFNMHEDILKSILSNKINFEPILKGTDVMTENYSFIAPEVSKSHDNKYMFGDGYKNIANLYKGGDKLLIAGEAASHCVKWSVDHLLQKLNEENPELISRTYILQDCMSAVAIPDGEGGFVADFTASVEDALHDWKTKGLNIVNSEDMNMNYKYDM